MKTAMGVCWILAASSLSFGAGALGAEQDGTGVKGAGDQWPVSDEEWFNYPNITTTLNDRESIQKVSALRGKTVENLEGEKLAKIQDLGLDFQSSRVGFLVLATDDPTRDQLKVVSVTALNPSVRTRGAFCLDLSRERWQGLQSFQKEQLLAMDLRSLERQVDPQHQRQWMIGKESFPTPTGRESAYALAERSASQLRLASDVIGKNVLSREGGQIGVATDCVVDLSGQKAAFLIVGVRRATWEGGGQQFAVPLPAVSMARGLGHLVINAPGSALSQLRILHKANWPDAGVAGESVEIFRYYD